LLVLNQNIVEDKIQIEPKRRRERTRIRVSQGVRECHNIFYWHVLVARTAGTNENYELELVGVDHPKCNFQP
jgi:hypothetical protein